MELLVSSSADGLMRCYLSAGQSKDELARVIFFFHLGGDLNFKFNLENGKFENFYNVSEYFIKLAHCLQCASHIAFRVYGFVKGKPSVTDLYVEVVIVSSLYQHDHSSGRTVFIVVS